MAEEGEGKKTGGFRGMLTRLKRKDDEANVSITITTNNGNGDQSPKRPSSTSPESDSSSEEENGAKSPKKPRRPSSGRDPKGRSPRENGSPREDKPRLNGPIMSPAKSATVGPTGSSRITKFDGKSSISRGKGSDKLLALHDLKSLDGKEQKETFNGTASMSFPRKQSADVSRIQPRSGSTDDIESGEKKDAPSVAYGRRRTTLGAADAAKSKIEPKKPNPGQSVIKKPGEDAAAEPKLTKKGLVQKEFIQTEDSYFRSLTILVEFYLKPLQNEKVIPPDDIAKIFSNIDTIFEIHKQLAGNLHRALIDTIGGGIVRGSSALESKNSAYAKFKQLELANEEEAQKKAAERAAAEKARQASEGKISFYDALRQFIPFLKMYTVYVNGFDEANKKMNHSLQKNKKFAAFCTKVKENPECNSLDLPAYLIMPIQRLPRYELLLRDLLKFVQQEQGPRARKEYEEMEVLLKTVQEVNQHVNSSKGAQQKRELLYKLNAAVKGKVDIFDRPDRQLVKEGLAHFASEGGNESAGAGAAVEQSMIRKNPKPSRSGWKKCHIFMFDDLLVVVNPKKFKYILQMNTKDLLLEPNDGTDEDLPIATVKFFEVLKEDEKSEAFVLQDSKEGHVYFFKVETENERNAWLRELKETVKSARVAEKQKEVGGAKVIEKQPPKKDEKMETLTSSMVNLRGGAGGGPGSDHFTRLKSQFELKG